MLTGQTRLIARDKREWTRDSVKRDLRVSLNNRGFSAFSLIARLCSAWSILNFAWANLIFAALSPWNWLVWNANINHKGLQRTANEYTEERRMLVWNAWTWIATCSEERPAWTGSEKVFLLLCMIIHVNYHADRKLLENTDKLVKAWLKWHQNQRVVWWESPIGLCTLEATTSNNNKKNNLIS